MDVVSPPQPLLPAGAFHSFYLLTDMTRLSEALRRAAEQDATTVPETRDDVVAPATWEFSPVETMHVPVEPSAPPAAPQAAESFGMASEPVAPAVLAPGHA